MTVVRSYVVLIPSLLPFYASHTKPYSTSVALTDFKKIINQIPKNTQRVTKKQNVLENSQSFMPIDLPLLLLAIEQTQYQNLLLFSEVCSTMNLVSAYGLSALVKIYLAGLQRLKLRRRYPIMDPDSICNHNA
ncbi:hypothetical protein BGAL_0243g00030 [Botrytis galanthina]|uniref:Uncharacterized protein n=1 Tax=Botrytis galanthina TaxID=278940 RepID=A0A4S8QTD4_9HELO|nr:hypothetical protein BGAL_0243g00030 [Botrytis galanthina]